MGFLDYYDINGNFLGKECREKVHADGLWHKTVHCWLYDDLGNVYFQLRAGADNNKMYTTASGHVDAGETLNQAFAREVKEEIGVDVNIDDAKMVEMVIWRMDKKKSDGTMWRDRAFSHQYINKIDSQTVGFSFDPNEVAGVIKIKARDALGILSKDIASANATKISNTGQEDVEVTIDDFLINPHEIGLIKYGRVLQAIIAEIQ